MKTFDMTLFHVLGGGVGRSFWSPRLVLLVQFIYKVLVTVSRAPKGPAKATIELPKKSSENKNMFVTKRSGSAQECTITTRIAEVSVKTSAYEKKSKVGISYF